jgi:two-component system chemotaxis sensor kinase CheA
MSDYLDPDNEELLKDFFAEAQSQVEALERNILAIEDDPGNKDAVDEIFRAAHTLKGGAATVRMDELSEFTHLIEDLLDAVRSGKAQVSGGIVDALLAAVDVVKAMLASRSEGAPYAEDVSTQKEALLALIPEGASRKARSKPQAASKPPAGAAAAARPSAAPKAAPAKGLTEYEILELVEAAGPESSVYLLRVRFDEANVMKTVGGIQVFAALKEVGKVLKTLPDFEALYGDDFYPVVDYYLGSSRSREDILAQVEIPDVVLGAELQEIRPAAFPMPPAASAQAAQAAHDPAASPRAAAAQAVSSQNAAGKADAPTGDAAEDARKDAAKDTIKDEDTPTEGATEAKKAAQQAGSILRVDSKRIDNLLNLVSETVITKATFNQISSRFGELLAEFQSTQASFRESIKELFDSLPDYLAAIQAGKSAKDVKKDVSERFGGLFTVFDAFEAGLKASVGKFRSTAQNLGRITGELQEGVMRIRMVPISQIFSRFPRLVRDLSKSLGKRVNLVIEGEDTELDKSVIEDLLDPLMHSVRNAIDHGVESPAERAAAGKPEEGMVLLKASNEGNMIVIEVADDGQGIDVEAVRRKAVERGLIHPSKSLTDPEAYALIFEPGFSTAKTVTNISGRGVGLDVVRTQIEKLNGNVTVHSQRGKGTRFIIKLPLTLAIIQGLLVRVEKEVYSIPITSVLESHRIKPDEIKMIDNYEVINIRNDVISLLRLDRLFRIKSDEKRDYFFVVIVGTAEKKMGLMVDSLIGEEDVVIKPLRDSFTASPGIAGASILGDGSVSLIIDVSQLLELGLRKEMEERRRREAGAR